MALFEKPGARYTEHMLQDLSADDRLLLVKFVCAFAWTDLTVTDGERRFVERLVGKLDLNDDDRASVAGWLEVAPPPSAIDPSLVPSEHRRVFVEAVRAVIYSDGEVDDEERDRFEKLKGALGV